MSKETVDHPSHYNAGSMEVIDAEDARQLAKGLLIAAYRADELEALAPECPAWKPYNQKGTRFASTPNKANVPRKEP